MTRDDYDRFTTVLRAFAELKSKALSSPAIELYWRAMQGWSLRDFEAAAEQLVRTCKFFPTPSEFEDLVRAQQETCGEAWSRAKAHAASLPVQGGFLVERAIGDELLDRVARVIGGYSAIARCGVESIGFLERRFCEHFEAMRGAEVVRQALPNLSQTKRIGGPKTAAALLGRTQ